MHENRNRRLYLVESWRCCSPIDLWRTELGVRRCLERRYRRLDASRRWHSHGGQNSHGPTGSFSVRSAWRLSGGITGRQSGADGAGLDMPTAILAGVPSANPPRSEHPGLSTDAARRGSNQRLRHPSVSQPTEPWLWGITSTCTAAWSRRIDNTERTPMPYLGQTC